MHRKRAFVTTLAFVALVVMWWFWITDWLRIGDPRSYRIATAYLVVGLIAGAMHVMAFIKFDRMTRIIIKAEKAGLAEPGSEIFARNQRLRYTVRIFEALWLVGLCLIAIWAVHDPKILLTHVYSKYVLTYLFGSVVATAFLTYKDLWVVSQVEKLNDSGAALRAVGRPPIHDLELPQTSGTDA